MLQVLKEETEGELQKLPASPRTNSLDSLLKEVSVFKEIPNKLGSFQLRDGSPAGPHRGFKAELIYDPSNSAAFTARTQCPIGAMVLGALLWITTPVTSCRGLASRPFLKELSAWSSLSIKFLGRILLDIRNPDVGMSRTKT